MPFPWVAEKLIFRDFRLMLGKPERVAATPSTAHSFCDLLAVLHSPPFAHFHSKKEDLAPPSPVSPRGLAPGHVEKPREPPSLQYLRS